MDLRNALQATLIGSIISLAVTSKGFAAESPLHATNCVMGKTRVQALCGYLQVFEDRRAQTGRTIDIHFVVLKATRPTHHAIFWNPGGPGAGATQFAPFIADGLFEKYLAKLRDRYDVVFVDNRGMGLSNELRCTLYSSADPQSYLLQIWPDAQLMSCRAALSKKANLSDYVTDFAADDLDDIRAALKYPKIALNGASGGTTFFLDYARRHPQHVESLLLQGVAPPHFLIIPLQDASGAQLAIDHIATDCENDPTCRAHFPYFRDHFAALVKRFESGPLSIQVTNTTTHQLQKAKLSKEVFADRLRQTMYSNGPAAYVPFIVERAYAGDYVPLGKMIQRTSEGLEQLVAVGANLSVTCAEDIPFITEADVAQSSAHSFMADTRVRAQQRACRIWNVQPVPATFQDPVRTLAPVFIISGAIDPATPPEYSSEALPYFTNGKRLLIVNASHDTEVPCADTLAEQFIRDRSVKNLKTDSCEATYHRPVFASSMAGF